MKNRYFKIPPEMVDGENWSIVAIDDIETLKRILGDWAKEGPILGDQITIEIIEMSNEEVEALPEL